MTTAHQRHQAGNARGACHGAASSLASRLSAVPLALMPFVAAKCNRHIHQGKGDISGTVESDGPALAAGAGRGE